MATTKHFSRHFVCLWMSTLMIALALGASVASPARGAVITVPTADGSVLGAALNPSGLTINAVTIANGVAGPSVSQFGTYSNFTLPPVTIHDGVVLSSGNVANLGPFAQPPGYSDPNSGTDPNVTNPPPQVNSPMDPNGLGGTPEYDAYGLSLNAQGNTRIENFQHSHDVAALRVDFHLDAASPIKFDFIFGSVEYPFYTSQFTDAFLVFLDGTAPANQIAFDPNGAPIQVGKSFAGLETTADQNTAFSNPHAVLPHLTTTSAELSAGDHTLWFEVGDVNDPILDSAVFIANLRAEAGTGGTEPTDGASSVPEPGTLALALSALGFAALGRIGRRRRRRAAL